MNGAMPDASETAAPTTCYRHTDRETGRHCTRCGRPACWECLRDAPVGAHCPECSRSERMPAGQQLKRTLRDPLLVTKTIVGLNVAMFVVQIVHGTSAGGILSGGSGPGTAFDVRWGLFPSAVAAGQYERLITSGFIHFGVMHILFNMLILYQLGVQMEAGIGRWRFGTIYFASLLGGSFAVVLLNDNTLSGGASGAVFGVAAAATIALWQRGVRFYQTGWGPLLVVNIVLTFVIPNISIGAHIGGLGAGSILGWVMLHPRHGVERKALGFVVAAIIAVGSFVGAVVVARHNYPACTHAALRQECTR